MAIQNTSANTTVPNSADPAQRPTPQPTAPAASSWSFHKSFMRAPVAKNKGSEQLAKLQEKLTETLKSATTDYGFYIIPVDSETEKLHYSAIVVCMQKNDDKDLGVAYHTLILEATGSVPEPVQITMTGQQVMSNMSTGVVFMKQRAASDVIDNTFVTVIQNKVRAAFPLVQNISADACVVPKDFNPEDVNAVQLLAHNVSMACLTWLSVSKKGFRDLNLAANAKDAQVQITQQYGSANISDDVGNVHRSDIVVSMSSQKQSANNNQSLNGGDSVEKISRTSGFVDIVYAPVDQMQMAMQMQTMFGAMPNMQMPTPPKYAARYVITHIAPEYLATPGGVWLAFYSALTVSEKNNWFLTFSNQYQESGGRGVKKINLRDPGAMGYEMNFDNNSSGVGTRIDTTSANFQPEHLGSLLTRCIRPGIMISMDIPEAGPQTWYSTAFAAAAVGDRAAYTLLYNALSDLTNGSINGSFKQGSNMFVDNGQRVHLGYFIDSDGVRQDLRKIDYLAIMNLCGETNPTMIRDWSDTWTRLDIPSDVRLAKRWSIIKGLYPSAELTGHALRVTFSPELCAAIPPAISSTGFVAISVPPYGGNELMNERGVGNVANALLSPNNIMFNHGGSRFNAAGVAQGSNMFPTMRWF